MLEEVVCPLCASNDSRFLFEAEDHNYGNAGRWRVVRCNQCGLGYQNPRIPPQEVHRYYPKDYYTHDSRQFVRVNWASRLLGTYVGVRLIRPPFHGARLLDIGSGTGELISQYNGLGWSAEGFDVDHDAANCGRTRGALVTVAPSLHAVAYESNSFDAITMWDSLEHVAEPLSLLREALRILRPTGHLWIGAPDLDSWPSRLFRENWLHVAAPVHYTYWSEASLRYAANLLGLRVSSITIPRKTACTRLSTLYAWKHRKVLKAAVHALSLPWKVVDKLLKGGHIVVAMKPGTG